MVGLPRSEYLKTVKGKISRYTYNRLNYSLCINIYVNKLKSKKRMNKIEKLNFQRLLLNELRNQRRRAFRSKIYLEVIFSANINNQTHIHKLAKNYLDLFGKPIDKSLKRKGLIYKDDRQIAFLSVKHRIDFNSLFTKEVLKEDTILFSKNLDNKRKQESIEINAMTWSKFIENLSIACELYKNLENTIQTNFKSIEEKEIFVKPFEALDIIYTFDLINTIIDSLNMLNILKSSNKHILNLITNIKKEIKEIYLQETITNLTMLDFPIFCSFLIKGLNFLELFRNINYTLFDVNISDFPSAKKIKERVEEKLYSLQKDLQIKSSIKIPISITIFVPINFIEYPLKDLDNFVAEAIIPPFLNILKPPPFPKLDWGKLKNACKYIYKDHLHGKNFIKNILNLFETFERRLHKSMIRSYNIILIDDPTILKDKIYIYFTNLVNELSIFRTKTHK